jgi:hypothetical protein
MANPHRQAIIDLVTNNKGQYTYAEVGEKFGIPTEKVRGVARNNGLSSFFLTKNCNGIINLDSTLQGVEAMTYQSKAQTQALLEECAANGIDVSQVKYWWHKSKRISMFVVAQERPTYDQIRDELIKEMVKHAPRYPTLKYKKVTDGHLLLIDPADIHIGKLAVKSETGYQYDMATAVRMVHEGIEGLLTKSKGFPVEKIVLVVGNDVLHRDSPHNLTTSGTRQDTDGMWHQAFIAARQMYVHIIERLMQVAPVHVVFNPSNHDYASGYMLADALYCWFNKSKVVTFDNDIIHRKYYQYGENLIATSHGDGAKFADMPLLMASESPKLWANTRHRYVYLHHLHHFKRHEVLTGKDFPGITIQYLRSPSASDAWHMKQGYTGAPQAIEAFIHHPTGGRVAAISHIF